MRRKTVGLNLSYIQGFSRSILGGAANYFAQHTEYDIQLPMGKNPAPDPLDQPESWDGDGMLSLVYNREKEAQLLTMPYPVVNVSAKLDKPRLPQVRPDNYQVGQLAANHFLDRGYRHFAVSYRYGNKALAHDRRAGFLETLRKAGVAAGHIHDMGVGTDPLSRDDLHAIPRPFAFFCIADNYARSSMQYLRALEIDVPEEVAVLGADEDRMEQDRCPIPLSSVDANFKQVGYRAAELLHRIMEGEPPEPGPLIIPPLGVVERKSTDAYGVADEAIRRVLAFVQANYLRPIGVPDLEEVACVSRRTLERRFKASLGYLPLEAIHRARLRRAKEILAHTDWAMERVAAQSGFADAKQMGFAFRKYGDLTPTAYRARFKTHQK